MTVEKKHVNHAKDHFRDNSSRPLDLDILRELFPQSTVLGTPQETGIAILNQSPFGAYVAAAVKHPQHIFDGTTFFGKQTEGMVEYSLITPIGSEQAAIDARTLLSQQAFPTIGTELEGYVHEQSTGRLVPAQSQIETAKSLREDPTDVCTSPEEIAVIRARTILERAEIEGARGNIVVDTGSPLTFGGEHPLESSGLIAGDHPYIQAMCRIFEKSYFIPSYLLDKRVQQVLNSYARSFGYTSIDTMLSELGVARVWDIAASHVSLGIPGPNPSIEMGIALANMFSSDLATGAEFLTQGSPLHAGQLVYVDNDNVQRPVQDVRTFSRKILRTAYVDNPFITSTDDLQIKVQTGVVEGFATTPDRAAFHTVGLDGVRSTSAHARARVRQYGERGTSTARVEFVGGSSTPSVYDVVARDAYLTILWVATLEAVANHQSPQEYFVERGFPSVGEWKNQQELAMRYSIFGASDQQVNTTLQENSDFLLYMRNSYPYLQDYIDFVSKRLHNLKEKSVAKTIDEYTLQPHGPISEVIARMKLTGYSDVEILLQLNNHQLIVSENIIACGGDFKALLNLVAK